MGYKRHCLTAFSLIPVYFLFRWMLKYINLDKFKFLSYHSDKQETQMGNLDQARAEGLTGMTDSNISVCQSQRDVHQ